VTEETYTIGSPEANRMDPNSLSDRERIARHFRKHIIDQASGRNVSGQGEDTSEDRVYRDFPSDRFFAGTLAPRSSEKLGEMGDDLESKMQPSALGSTVRLGTGDSNDQLSISVSGAAWVRVYPTYEELEQREEYVSTTEGGDTESEDILPVFAKLNFDAEVFSVRRERLEELAHDRGQPEPITESISTIFEDIAEEARNRDDIYLVDPDEGDRQEIPDWALESEEDYQTFLDEIEGVPAIPEWSAKLELRPSPDLENPSDDALVVDIEFANHANTDSIEHWKTLRDPTLFEVQLSLETSGELEFIPYTFDPLPEDFRYNRDLWGHGRNCTVQAPEYDVRRDPEKPPGVQAPEAGPSTSILQTEFLPEHRQRVYESADRDLNTRFETFTDLQGEGLSRLREIAESMKRYKEEKYNAALEEYSDRSDWSEEDRQDFEEDREKFEREIQRFERGIDALERRPDIIGRSFEMMNETMRRKHDFESWHLFQLVFIVILLPDIASREFDEFSDIDWREDEGTEWDAESALEVVDVLWFPTGGGKTEAFLGVAVWNMFFDRIRGKDFGVTTWTRFPLRLLSLQQVQRMAETITTAEIVRREEGDQDGIATRPSRPFSIGYLVGKANTPNALTGYDNNNRKRYEDNEDLLEETKVVSRCPACDADVRLRVTDDDRLAHYCTNSSFECDWQKRPEEVSETYSRDELPVHIVDNELYRYAPTILAGTIDKIAAIGYQRKMAHLLTGEIDAECPIHGFASLGECTEKYGCDIEKDNFEAMSHDIEPYDAAPSLMVPDELHLLKESMGSFDGHYETGVEYLQDIADAGKTKILAPTATITGYEDQVYHLYTRPAERFPSPGPFLRENYYATEKEKTERYYLGIVPHGRTHINSILEVLYQFHLEIQTLLQQALTDPEGFLNGKYIEDTVDSGHPLQSDSILTVLEQLLQYSTSLTYLLSKKDGDRLNQSIKSQLDEYFSNDNRPPLEQTSMTGGTPFDEIQGTLDKLEQPWESTDHEDVIERLSADVLSDEIASDVSSIYEQIGAVISDEESDVFGTTDPETAEEAITNANDDVSTGLAWVLASWPNAITATSMVSHGVDVNRFNMMVFFGMPRRTAEYIQSSSRAGRDAPGLVFNIMHPIRERDLSHYHFFEKYHEFLDRLVEPVAINRWAKNSIQRTHSGLLMGLLLNHYMYQTDENLYFGDNAEDFIRGLEQENENELEDALVEMIGGDAAPEEFAETTRRLTNTATNQLRVDDNKWTSNRLPHGAMTSLRDVDEQLPIRPEYDFKEIFEALDER
jgi:hypothetical protein